MADTAQDVIERIHTERQQFEQFCRTLSDAELDRPVPGSAWIVKDFISHLATIDGPVRAWFASIRAGNLGSSQREGGTDWGIDAFNDAQVMARREWSVEQILAEAQRERASLVEVLAAFTASDMESTIRFGGDAKRPPSDVVLGQYLRGWANHDAMHVADMLRALPDRRTDPQVVAWLSQPETARMVTRYTQVMA